MTQTYMENHLEAVDGSATANSQSHHEGVIAMDMKDEVCLQAAKFRQASVVHLRVSLSGRCRAAQLAALHPQQDWSYATAAHLRTAAVLHRNDLALHDHDGDCTRAAGPLQAGCACRIPNPANR